MTQLESDFAPLVTPTKEAGGFFDVGQKKRPSKWCTFAKTTVLVAGFVLSFTAAFLSFDSKYGCRLRQLVTTKPKRKVSVIHFIGERHSGTRWMFGHLSECFDHDIQVLSNFTRWKHWFQWDTDLHHTLPQNSLVIAQFRNVYDWVEAMRERPYHAPYHRRLEWRDFVTKPWTTDRWGLDLNMTNTTGRCCVDEYHYDEIVPCNADQYYATERHPHYELRVDRSGLPYDSIVDMRADKIRNFLTIPTFRTVGAFLPVRYEDLVRNGTAGFLRQVEQLTGVQAKCTPFQGREVNHKDVDPSYLRWMNHHVDWDAENMIGYNMVANLFTGFRL